MKKVSVVILNWNGEKLLRKFLPTVLKHTQTDDCEVVVVDNGSSDKSVEVMNHSFPNVKLILLDKNYGFAEGYNRALLQVDSEYVILLNSDVETSDNWVNPLVAFLDKHQEVVAVQPKIISYKNKSMFEYAGAAGGFIDMFGYPFCRGRVLHIIEEDKGQYDTPVEVFWATGACLCIRKNDYIEVGGLDNKFFAHMEEIDLCWRLLARGKNIYCIPESKVYHLGGASLDSESPQKLYLNFRNNLLMLYKNAPLKQLILVSLVRPVLDIGTVGHFLVKRKWRYAQSVCLAYIDFFKMKVAFKQKRKENLKQSVQTDIPQLYKGVMLFDFYFRRRQKYSDIIREK